MKKGSREYQEAFDAFRRSRQPSGATNMVSSWGWSLRMEKEFDELHKDELEPADPPPAPAKGNFKW